MFADFFTLRFGKGQQSWLDAHNVAGVLALPFGLMITYTGLVTLMFVAMPWAISAAYPVRDAFFDAVAPSACRGQRPIRAPFCPLTTSSPVRRESVLISFPVISWSSTPAMPMPSWRYCRNATDFQSARRRPPERRHRRGASAPQAQGPAIATNGVMMDLHVRFADPVLRWLYLSPRRWRRGNDRQRTCPLDGEAPRQALRS